MDKSKKILILGGSHRDIPLIKASQELGYFVITLGNGKGYLGHSYSDKFYNINFNELSKVKEIIRDEQIDYLVPGCGEESYLNTVQLNQELKLGNLDNLETANLVHNKWKFKEFCLKYNISTPKGLYYQENNTNFEQLNFPIVVKPTNLSGGRGVDIVYNKNELENSLKKSQKISDEIFLEEFIDGELIAYSVFIKNQEILYSFSGKDDTYKNKYLITTAYPIKLKDKILNKLKNDITKIVKTLNFVNGMFHLQVIIKDEIPCIIDVTRRIPGDFYPNLIEYCDGVEYSKAVVKSYIGLNLFNEFKITKKQDFIIRHCVMSDRNGIYKKLLIDDSLKDSIIYKFDLLKEDTKIENYLNTQISIIFIKIDIKDIKILKNINQLISLNIK